MLYWIFLYPSILVKSEEGYNQGHYDLLDMKNSPFYVALSPLQKELSLFYMQILIV